MSAPTVPVSETSHRILKELIEQTGQSMTEVLEQALDAYRRQVFFEKLNIGYAELQAAGEEGAKIEAEQELLDATLMDGLDPDEHWTEDGRRLNPENDES